MDKKTITKKYKIQDQEELDKYLKWCRSKGWKPGTGVECTITCKHRCEHNSHSDHSCNYLLDTGHRRPCPPWDCTEYEKGLRRKPNDRL